MTFVARRARPQTAEPPHQRLPREIWVLITANAMIALGYGVVAPVLPSYARHFGVSITAATFVITVVSLMRLCFAPVSGLLVQRIGERRMYVAGLLIVATSTVACAFAQTYWQLLVFRALGGVGSTMFFISSLGLMIRISPADARGRISGMFASAFLVGSVGGPVLGSLTASLGLSAPFLIYGAMLLVAATVVFVSLRHSPLAAPAPTTEPTVTVRAALRHRAYRSALLSNFATGWAVFGLRIAGLSTSGAATMLLGEASSLPVFLAAACLTGVTSGIFSAPQQAAIADIIGSNARAGTAIATFQMMADVGAVTGSVAVGEIAQHVTFGWGFAISGIVLLIAAVGWVAAPETRPLVTVVDARVSPDRL